MPFFSPVGVLPSARGREKASRAFAGDAASSFFGSAPASESAFAGSAGDDSAGAATASTTGVASATGAAAASSVDASTGAFASAGSASDLASTGFAAATAASGGASVALAASTAGASAGAASTTGVVSAACSTGASATGAATASTGAVAPAAAAGASSLRRPTRRRTVGDRVGVEESAEGSRRLVAPGAERPAPPAAGTEGGPLGDAEEVRRRMTRRPTRVSPSPFPLGAGGDMDGAFETVRAGRRLRVPPRMTRSKRSFFDIHTSSARGWTTGVMDAAKQLWVACGIPSRRAPRQGSVQGGGLWRRRVTQSVPPPQVV